MSWGPQQPVTAASDHAEGKKPGPLGWLKTLLLGLLVLIVLPIWLYQTFDNWYNQRPTDNLDVTAQCLLTYSHSEILLAEAAERHQLPSTVKWMISTQQPDHAVADAVSLLRQFHDEYPETSASSGVDIKLSSLYLRLGDKEKALETAKTIPAPFQEIIQALASGQSLSLIQLDVLEDYQDQYPGLNEAAFWYSMHLENLKTQPAGLSITDPEVEYFQETENADRKLFFRCISVAFCYSCLAIGIIYLLINFRTIDRLQPPAISPPFISGMFVFLLLEYSGSYVFEYVSLFCHRVLQLPDQYTLIISEDLYRIIPAIGALIFLHFAKGKDSSPLLSSFRMTLPATCIFWGVGIFTCFILHSTLSPHLIGDYITGLEGYLSGKDSTVLNIHSLISAIIIAPIAEEIIFRGLLLPTIQKRLGTFISLFASSLIFSLVHVQGITGTLHIFILGGLLGITYLKTRSLWPGIIAHAGFNAWLHFDTWNVYLAN